MEHRLDSYLDELDRAEQERYGREVIAPTCAVCEFCRPLGKKMGHCDLLDHPVMKAHVCADFTERIPYA